MATAQLTRFDERTEQRMRNVYQTLSEKDRRRFAAIEAVQLGHGGISYIAEVLGCSIRTISRGIEELDQLDEVDTPGRIRRPGAGRPKKSRPARTLRRT
jgi:predicted ArsR family transcriptional regulator